MYVQGGNVVNPRTTYMYYTPFTLHPQNRSEPVQTGSAASVNGHGTVPSETVPLETVPPRRGGPNRFRTVPLASVNATVLNRSVPL